MAIFSCSFLINWRRFGFAETFHKEAPDIPSIVQPCNLYLAARHAMLPEDASMGLRISVDGDTRRGTSYAPGNYRVTPGTSLLTVPAAGTYKPKTATGWDQARACLQLDGFVNNARVGIRYLAPVPDAVTATDQEAPRWGTETAFRDAFDEWVRIVLDNDWGTMVTGGVAYSVPGAAVGPEVEIVRFTLGAAPANNLVVEIKHELRLNVGEGDYLTVTKARMRYRDEPSPNGKWKIESVTEGAAGGPAQRIELAGTAGINVANIRLPGEARKWFRIFLNYDQISIRRIGKHDRGGPFFVTRGRGPRKRDRL